MSFSEPPSCLFVQPPATMPQNVQLTKYRLNLTFDLLSAIISVRLYSYKEVFNDICCCCNCNCNYSYSCYSWQKPHSPESKGKRGENYVAKILGDTIIGEQYVINNLLFQNEKGQSCQIDHVFINKFGIWVIETKNYAGTIYGQENQREWTQVLAHSMKLTNFIILSNKMLHIYIICQIT